MRWPQSRKSATNLREWATKDLERFKDFLSGRAVKDQISEQNSKERDQYNDFINESFNEYCQELDQKVGKDYQSAIKLFESKIETLTNDIFAEKIHFLHRHQKVKMYIHSNWQYYFLTFLCQCYG